MPGIHKKAFILFASCLCFTFFPGCVSPGKKSDILALVDNEPITGDDLKYSLEIEHRRQDLSSAKSLDIPLYVQKLINNRLIIQEAYRNGLDEDPDVQMKVEDFIIRESVTRLYTEEVLQKVRVTEDDMKDYYRRHYEQFSLDIIEADTEKEALELLGRLRDGIAFKELSLLHPSGFPRNEEGAIILSRIDMQERVADTIDGLDPGEFSGVVPVHGKFYIIQLIGRQKGPDSQFDKGKDAIARTIRDRKIKERSAGYLQRLREEAPVRINRQLLSTMNLSDREKWDSWFSDERVLVEVFDSKLTAGEFTAMLPKNITKPEEKHLQGWIDIKVVDHTAINRRYDREPEFRKRITRYRNELLIRAFFDKIVYPQIEVTEENLMNYYQQNQQQFIKPVRYKIQQITLKSRNDAEQALESLEGGAQFSWLARQVSVDRHAKGGGSRGWVVESQLHEKMREIIGTLRPGEISPAVNTGNGFVIIRLQEKTEGEVDDFANVRQAVMQAYTSQEVRNLHDTYLTRLKDDAEIIVYDDAVKSFERGISERSGL